MFTLRFWFLPGGLYLDPLSYPALRPCLLVKSEVRVRAAASPDDQYKASAPRKVHGESTSAIRQRQFYLICLTASLTFCATLSGKGA